MLALVLSSGDCADYRVVVHTVQYYDILICQLTVLVENLVYQYVRIHNIGTTVLHKSDCNITLTTPALKFGVMRPLACWDFGFEPRRGMNICLL